MEFLSFVPELVLIDT